MCIALLEAGRSGPEKQFSNWSMHTNPGGLVTVQTGSGLGGCGLRFCSSKRPLDEVLAAVLRVMLSSKQPKCKDKSGRQQRAGASAQLSAMSVLILVSPGLPSDFPADHKSQPETTPSVVRMT